MKTGLITHRIENNICVVKITRKFVSPEIPELVNYIKHLLQEKTIRGLLINLKGDILIDSVLIEFLITPLKECHTRQIKYALCEINTDFTQISQIFQNLKSDHYLKSDHFLGIFETEADALKSFEERNLASRQPADKSLVSKTRVVTKDTFYFVGPKISWQFSRKQLTAGGIFSVAIFVIIIATTIYQQFFYQSLFAQLRQQGEKQSIENQALVSFSKEMEQQHLTFEQQIDQKEFLLKLSMEQQHLTFEQQIDQKEFLLKLSQETSPSDPKKDATLGEKKRKFLKEISGKKKTFEAKTALLDNLKSQHKKSLGEIRLLEKKATDLEKQLKEK